MSQQPPYKPGPSYPHSYPYQPLPQRPAPSNWQGIVALICGIIAILTSFIPVVNFGAIAFGLAAVVFGVIGLLARHLPKALSITGIVLGAVAVVISVLVLVLTATLFNAFTRALDQYQSEVSDGRHVSYEVTVDSGQAVIEYASQSGHPTATTTGTWRRDVVLLDDTDTAAVAASGTTPTGSQHLTCRLVIDGEIVDTSSGTGSVACTDVAP